MSPGTRIEYRVLREVNPEAARLAVLEYLRTNGGNKSDAARAFGFTRPVVYDILKKQAEGDLSDRSRVPKRQPNKTPRETETRVMAAKNNTRLGPKRLYERRSRPRAPHIISLYLRRPQNNTRVL